jgi:hypothetical protein
MNYRASQELIDILLKHGFTENTHIDWPDHIELLEERGEYDPGSIKRRFRKGRIVIMFNYTNIYITYQRQQPFLTSSNVPFHTLKTILFFLNQESYTKRYIIKHGSFNSFNNYMDDMRKEGQLFNAEKSKYLKVKKDYKNFVIE